MNQTETSPLHMLLDSIGRCFTPEVASQIVELRAPSEFQARLDYLADRSGEGTLQPDEQSEYLGYVQAIDLISVLQAKARNILAHSSSE